MSRLFPRLIVAAAYDKKRTLYPPQVNVREGKKQNFEYIYHMYMYHAHIFSSQSRPMIRAHVREILLSYIIPSPSRVTAPCILCLLMILWVHVMSKRLFPKFCGPESTRAMLLYISLPPCAETHYVRRFLLERQSSRRPEDGEKELSGLAKFGVRRAKSERE